MSLAPVQRGSIFLRSQQQNLLKITTDRIGLNHVFWGSVAAAIARNRAFFFDLPLRLPHI
jgi:hypothetical protein